MTPQELKADLEDILQRWRFKANVLSHCVGKLFWVESIPWRQPRTNRWHLTVQILPLGPEATIPSEAIEGAREACQEALEDPNPNVRAHARLRLEQLKRPRIRLADLAGLRLTLDINGEEKQAEVDAQGRALFTDVIPTADCSLKLAEAEIVAPVGPRGPGRGGVEEVKRPEPATLSFKIVYLAPGRRPFEPQPLEQETWRGAPCEAYALSAAPAVRLEAVRYFTDNRITLELAKDSAGQLWLTVWAIDTSLMGGTVRYRFGTAQGSVPLRSEGTRVKLGLTEEAARTCEPELEIIPPAQPEQ